MTIKAPPKDSEAQFASVGSDSRHISVAENGSHLLNHSKLCIALESILQTNHVRLLLFNLLQASKIIYTINILIIYCFMGQNFRTRTIFCNQVFKFLFQDLNLFVDKFSSWNEKVHPIHNIWKRFAKHCRLLQTKIFFMGLTH